MEIGFQILAIPAKEILQKSWIQPISKCFGQNILRVAIIYNSPKLAIMQYIFKSHTSFYLCKDSNNLNFVQIKNCFQF